MKIREEAKIVMGVEISPTVGPRLFTAIENPVTSVKTAYSLGVVAYHLGFDPTHSLMERFGTHEGDEIMTDIKDAEFYDREELRLNILHVACVWAHQAKDKIKAWPVDRRLETGLVIDALAARSVQYWTLEPIFDQNSVPGVPQRKVSRILKNLVEAQQVLTLVKQSRGQGESNAYGLHSLKDVGPDEIRRLYDNLNLVGASAEEQIAEYTQALQPALAGGLISDHPDLQW